MSIVELASIFLHVWQSNICQKSTFSSQQHTFLGKNYVLQDNEIFYYSDKNSYFCSSFTYC